MTGQLGFKSNLVIGAANESDLNLGTISYGNPFPAAWGTSLSAGCTWGMSYTAHGASAPATQGGGVYLWMPPEKASAGPIEPLVTPVLEPLVDGKDAFGPLDGISATPTLSWKKPAVGAPNFYRVYIGELTNEDGASSLPLTTTMTTTDTKLSLPPDLLQKGHAYVFTIVAIVSERDGETAPFRGSATFGYADVLTSVALP